MDDPQWCAVLRATAIIRDEHGRFLLTSHHRGKNSDRTHLFLPGGKLQYLDRRDRTSSRDQVYYSSDPLDAADVVSKRFRPIVDDKNTPLYNTLLRELNEEFRRDKLIIPYTWKLDMRRLKRVKRPIPMINGGTHKVVRQAGDDTGYDKPYDTEIYVAGFNVSLSDASLKHLQSLDDQRDPRMAFVSVGEIHHFHTVDGRPISPDVGRILVMLGLIKRYTASQQRRKNDCSRHRVPA